MSLKSRIAKLEADRFHREAIRFPPGTLDDPALFNDVAGSRPFRPYQAEVARAVVESLEAGRGDVITVMMARQMGKNQTSAGLEHYLLHRYARSPYVRQVVKCAPTWMPQIVNSKLRLEAELGGQHSKGRWRPVYGYGLQMGRARILFYSAAPEANVVGATADLLLEVDEAQDIDEEKYLRDFRPMASTTNATTVLYGTAWSEDCLLEKQRRFNLEQQERLGRRLHFEYTWEHLAAVNPAYRAFVEAEMARLGAGHPVIRTQYRLEAVAALGKLFSAEQRRLLRGDHERLSEAVEGEAYVAGVDVAGEDEEAADAVLRALKPRRDSTVVTIGRVSWTEEREPSVEVVEQYQWTGRDHKTQLGDLQRLLRDVWAVRKVVVDATGVGAGLASWLEQEFSEDVVEQFAFSAPAKSRLGFLLLGMINTGRCRLYAGDGSEEYREFWHQVERARYEMRANEQLRWHVPEAEGHDDFLTSLALCCWAADLAAAPGESAVVRPRRMVW
jgi:hypothetical protein